MADTAGSNPPYALNLMLSEEIGLVPATVTPENEWTIEPDIALKPKAKRAIEQGIALTVAASFWADREPYIAVWDMRWAIQALRAYPGSEALTEYPHVEGRVY